MAKNTTKKNYHHGDLQNSIIKSILHVLKLKHPDKISLRELAKEAKVSHTAIYRHFEDKDILMDKIATIGFEKLYFFQNKFAMMGKDPRESLQKLGLAYIVFFLRNPGMYKVMFDRKSNKPSIELKKAQLRSFALVIKKSRNYISYKKRGGNPRNFGVLAWSMVHGYAGLSLNTDFTKIEAKKNKMKFLIFSEKILQDFFD